jgi:CheY-like chemotaxis protein
LAEQASKLKSSLLANMSHELRTPLNGILGFAQVLKDELEDQPHHTMVEKIVRSAKRLMTTLNSILDLSLIETSEQLIEKEIIDLGNQSALISSEFQDACNDKGLDLQFIPTTEDLPVAVSGRYFKQILSNLLDNAVKFTREGSVTVEAQSNYMDSGKWAVVKVTDTGIGIDEKDRDLIFQEFRQVSEGFSRSFEGTGLGLTIVRKIVEKLHGSIDFESRLGAGTTFTVKFPFAEAVQEKMETETTSVETVEDRKKREKDVLPIVLLAEDNDINRDIVTLYLADICKIESVKDGESAVAAAEKQSFDLILMDINLGKGISGLEAAKQIRKIDGYTDTPIVAITGYALAGDKKKLLEEGMTHYLAKPFQREEITELVSEILNQQSAQT